MTYYAFLIKRPRDSQPWPTIFSDRVRAEAYEHRASPVVPVQFFEPTSPRCDCRDYPGADEFCTAHKSASTALETSAQRVEGVVAGSSLERQIQSAREAIEAWPAEVKRAMRIPL